MEKKNTIPKDQAILLDGKILDLSQYPNLEEVIIDGKCLKSELDSLSLSGCSKLKILGCSRNNLTSLNLNGCSNLKKLWCSDNKINTLDASDCLDLEEIYCKNNLLGEVILSDESRGKIKLGAEGGNYSLSVNCKSYYQSQTTNSNS